MTESKLEGVTAPPTSTHLKHAGLTNGDALASAQARYNSEREKRMQNENAAQFADLFSQEKFKHFQADPWFEKGGVPVLGDPKPPREGDRNEFLIAGTGYGGLLFAVRLLQAGFKVEDIRMVDSAGGFGGTWCKSSLTLVG